MKLPHTSVCVLVTKWKNGYWNNDRYMRQFVGVKEAAGKKVKSKLYRGGVFQSEHHTAIAGHR